MKNGAAFTPGKRLLLALSFLAFAAFPKAAAAQYMSTQELGRMCLSNKKEQMAACINYVAGVIDYHFLMTSFGTAPTIDFCLPDSITKEKAAVIVMAYLRTHANHDAFTAASVIPLALNKAFPCRVQPRKKKKGAK